MKTIDLNDRAACPVQINADTIAAFRANLRRAERIVNGSGFLDQALVDALEDFRRAALVASGKLVAGHDYHDYVEFMERYDDRAGDEWIIRLANRIAA